MSRVKATLMVGERLTTVEVDRAVLSRVMQVSSSLARAIGRRPGEHRKESYVVANKLVEYTSTPDKDAVQIASALSPQPQK